MLEPFAPHDTLNVDAPVPKETTRLNEVHQALHLAEAGHRDDPPRLRAAWKPRQTPDVRPAMDDKCLSQIILVQYRPKNDLLYSEIGTANLAPLSFSASMLRNWNKSCAWVVKLYGMPQMRLMIRAASVGTLAKCA